MLDSIDHAQHDGTKTLCLCAICGPHSWRRRRRRRPTARVVAIRGGTVLTVTRGTIANGIVVLRDGKIAAVGGAQTRRFRPAPRPSTRPAASCRPGIIDAHSHIAADSINEGGTTVSSMTGIEDVLDPTDVNIFRDLAGGLTVGQRAARQRQSDRRQEHGHQAALGQARDRASWCSKARCRASSSRSARTRRTCASAAAAPSRRRVAIRRRDPGVEFVIRDAFTRAKAYQREWQDYERRRKAPKARRRRRSSRRAAICSSSRWSRSSKASASSTRTAIAPTKS